MTLRSISRNSVQPKPAQRDLRSFEVRSRGSSKRLGTVHDALVDDEGRTRYLCVAEPGSDRHVLLPAGEADADRDESIVWVAHDDLVGSLPDWSHAAAAPDEELERRIEAQCDAAYDGDRWHDRAEYRGGSWSAGTGDAATGKLERLDSWSEYTVARDDPDPRGWAVSGGDGRMLGTVDTLIGDTGSMRVVYLAVKVIHDVDPAGRTVLIPAGVVDLDVDRRRVIARGFDADCVAGLPRWSGRAITDDDAKAVVLACDRIYTGTRRYEHPRFRDDGLGDASRPAVW